MEAAPIPDQDSAEPDLASDSQADDAVAGDYPPEDAADSERDEAADDEIHDVALAAEKSAYSPHGHEVTYPPRDDDQGESIRIVTEAVEQSGPGTQPAMPPQPPTRGSSPSSPRPTRGADRADGESEDVS
jgi:hypothetical protein